ncbi:MAG: glutathione S- transferase, nitrogen catabolite repression regulator [Alectoria fallacina]|uniref:Glutathione S- transferase, nitrogen catabolite repression regulator n=1 Tax=Alectoria fallacina TaxID=1903189 RepID=A0A8H3PI03_9LECA|nr:MAG: glutathione S- transferase, nitrogen catabolite repression regulator [Alectoria fallacina]
MTQTITLWSHKGGPNPWKVAILLEELGLPYETKFLDMQTEVKAQPYTDKNPNGRVPTIDDPNTGITLWESGAIIEYLIDHYDKSNSLTYPSFPEKYYCKQYLHFQTSGQGPYFGQAAWFNNFHPEKVQSAKDRYVNEIKRVTTVLDTILKDKDYLVGDKCTYADLSFVTWYQLAPYITGDTKIDFKGDYPHYYDWMERLTARPAVKKVLEDKQKASSG